MSRESIKAVINKHETGCSEGQTHTDKVLRPHFPVNEGHRHYNSSGATIGPGIDLGSRTPKEIRQLFKGALSQEEIVLLQKAAFLKGKQAENWTKKHKNVIKLSEEGFNKIFDREFDAKQKIMDRIVSSKEFRQKYGVDGKQLMKDMKLEYKIALYDLLYLGRNSRETRQNFIPYLVKIHKNQATEKDRLVYIMGTQKEETIQKKIINNGIKEQPKDLFKTNKQFKEVINNTNSQKMSSILHKKSSNKVGGVDLSYDLSSITINGLQFEQNLTQMHLKKGENPYLRDLIVPLKIYYFKVIQYKNISISIDPKDPKDPDGPQYQKVYYPRQMEGTYFAQMMVEADYLMKQLILGIDEKGRPFEYPKSLKNVGLAFEDQLQYMDILQERTRQWIVIKKVHFLQNDQNGIEIGQIEMGLQARVQHIGQEGRLADSQTELSTHIKKFCSLFTKHYDILSQEYQSFRIIKRLAKASIIAELMFKKGCRINEKLIDELFKLQMTDKSSKIVPKIANVMVLSHNQLPLLKCNQSNKIKLNLTGGCDLSYKEQMATMQSQNHMMGKENQQDYIPFLFQDYVQCEQKDCHNIRINGAAAIPDTKCAEHTANICQIGWKLLKQGQKFVKLNDERLIHPQCFHCQACYGYIKGNYIERETLFYHSECSHKIIIGSCYACGSEVSLNSEYLTGNRGLIHKHCSQNFQCEVCQKKQSLLKLINLNDKFYHKACIKCCICGLVIQGDNFTFGANGFLHEQCILKITCQLCKLSIEGPYQKLGNNSYHPSCLVCFKCKKALQNQIKCDNSGHFYHPNCI